jgi:uncharacterized protein YcbK (DUF882 family)
MTTDTKLSRNLTTGEITCRCGCGFNAITPETIDTFQAIRDHAGRPIIITSGCRCARHNASVGGVAKSAHITGQALDMRIHGMTNRQFGDMIKQAHREGKVPYLKYCYLISDTAVHIGADEKTRTGLWGW